MDRLHRMMERNQREYVDQGSGGGGDDDTRVQLPSDLAAVSPPAPDVAATAVPEDCLSCRVMGTVTFTGVSAMLFREWKEMSPKRVGDRRAIAVMGMGFGVLGVYRAIM